MAVLTLPENPAPANMSVSVITAKNILTPAFGGSEQELLRKGTRFEIKYQMPPMTYVQSMGFDDLLAEGDTVSMRVYEPGLVIGAAGVPLVNGAGQSGNSLNIKGLVPGYFIPKGKFLSVVTAGQRFLYRARAQSVANGSGVASVPLRTMLRRSPANNDVVEIATPRIEGFVRDLGEWSVGPDRLVGLQFTVRERE